MTLTKQARTSEWIVDDEVSAKLSLYSEIADPLKRGARKGIRKLTGRAPQEHDVEEVAFLSFNVLWRKERDELADVGAMAFRIAYFAGQDRGRRIVVEQRHERPTAPDELRVADADEMGVDETALGKKMEFVARCREGLTDEQLLVISATIEGEHGEKPMKLAEWVRLQSSEKTYEAWRRQKERGLASLKKCVQNAMTTSVESGLTNG